MMINLSDERFIFCLLLASACHLTILFGMSFTTESQQPAHNKLSSQAVQVVLRASDAKPQHANLLGEQHQSGDDLTQRQLQKQQTAIEQTIIPQQSMDALSTASIKPNRPSFQAAIQATPAVTADVKAKYIAYWREHIEQLGNQQYRYLNQQTNGKVVLKAVVKHDGSLLNVDILRSSGNKDLDSLAIQTVKSAAPYQPFSTNLKAHYKQLEIVRTWQFQG